MALRAFVFLDADGGRTLHPLCEINARMTFGLVARAHRERAFRDGGEAALPFRFELPVG